MKWLLEGVLVLLLIMLGASFWSLLKANKHFNEFMNDEVNLTKFLDFWGKSKFVSEASEIKPVFGTWQMNIDSFTVIHFSAIQKTRNMCLFGTICVIATSWFFLPIPFVLSNLAIFFLLAVLPINSSLESQNYAHAQTILMNLYRLGSDSNNFQIEACPTNLRTAWKILDKWSI